MRIQGCRRACPPRGIALVMTLAIVLLVSMFLSEFIFSTGLDLRGMANVRDSMTARNLAKSAFRAAQAGLLEDETVFMQGYAQLQSFMKLGGAPFEDGLLTQFSVQPLDGLFNINELRNLQVGKDADLARRILFINTVAGMRIPASDFQEARALGEEAVLNLYAALFDWIDSDDLTYNGIPGYSGAEQDSYFGSDPEYTVKNSTLDRLEEIRLVRGVATSELPWSEWESHFAAIPKSTRNADYPLPERLNVNLASRDEIVQFLRMRETKASYLDGFSPQLRKILEDINKYALHAEDIADLLAPAEGQREVYTAGSLQEVLKRIGDINLKLASSVFSTYNEYYHLRLTVAVSEISAHIEAVVHVTRNAERVGTRFEILYVTLN